MKKLLLTCCVLALGVVPIAASAQAAETRNVVFLVNGNLGDKSFFDSAKAGLDKLAEDGRITLNTVEMGGTDADQPKWLSTLYEVADSMEYDLIVCGTYQMPDYLKEVAEAYPDQKFLIFDDDTYANHINRFAAIHQNEDIHVYLSTNDPAVSEETYQRLCPTVHIHHLHGNAPEDLFMLSECDFLIGPPSTFSLVAAMYRDIPLYRMDSSDETAMTTEAFQRFDYWFRRIL